MTELRTASPSGTRRGARSGFRIIQSINMQVLHNAWREEVVVVGRYRVSRVCRVCSVYTVAATRPERPSWPSSFSWPFSRQRSYQLSEKEQTLSPVLEVELCRVRRARRAGAATRARGVRGARLRDEIQQQHTQDAW